MKKLLPLFFFMGLLFNVSGYSQAGNFDADFGTNGKVITDIGSNLRDLVLQPDGKIVAVGDMDPAGTTDKFVVARYMPDGTLDSSFGTEGSLKTIYGAKCGAASVVLQSDGKIVVAGYTSNNTNNSGHYDAMIVRYNTNGTLDEAFGIQGVKILPFQTNGKSTAVDIQADGKIIIGGLLNYEFMVARLLENGDLDLSFNNTGYATYGDPNGYYEVGALKVLNSGKILVTGRGNNKFIVIKYNENGITDTSFGSEGVLYPAGISAMPAIVYNMLTFDNGDFIIIGGAMYGEKYNGVMVKFDSNGLLIPEFGTNGVLITDLGTNISSHGIDVVSAGNKIFAGYAAGPASNYDFRLSAYSMDGVLDTTFGDEGSKQFYFASAGMHDYLNTVIMQPDGKIVMGGSSATGGFSMARIASGVLGTNEIIINNNNTFGIYPNPITANSKLITNLSVEGRFTLNIYDIQGKLILNLGEKDFISGVSENDITLPDLGKGIYFLKIRSLGKEISTLKIVYQ